MLKEKLTLWTGPTTSVQVALGIKVFKPTASGEMRMQFLKKSRGTDSFETVEFGTMAPPPPKIQLAIEGLFWATDFADDFPGQFLYSDLEEVRYETMCALPKLAMSEARRQDGAGN